MKIDLFPTPISITTLSENEYNSVAPTIVKFLNDNYDGLDNKWTKSNTLSSYGYGKNDSLPDLYYNEDLLNSIMRAGSFYLTENLLPERDLLIKDIWVNVAGNGSFQELHCHTTRDNVLSGILYISIDGATKNTNFRNPNKLFKLLDESSSLSHDYELEANNGMMVIFPSFLEHFVAENKSNMKRVTVAFNLSYK